uniref:PDGF_2 domain-containing protein n=1 Tax=Steinernema glaseri TaxID=37863 RepID=A0A1I7Z385_9BILA
MRAACRFSLALLAIAAVQASREKRCGFRCDNVQQPDLNWDNFPPSQEPQCPCVRPPGSSKCVSYDSRLQAASLDEAILNFRDLAPYDPDPKPLYTGEPARTASAPYFAPMSPQVASAPTQFPQDDLDSIASCTTEQCLKCKLMVLRRFVDECGNCTKPYFYEMQWEMNMLSRRLGGHDDCDFFNKKEEKAPPPLPTTTTTTEKKVEEVASEIKKLLASSFGGTKERRKREEGNMEEKIIGMTSKIECRYRRGEEIVAGSQWSGLCNFCWSWRRLPPAYFPPLLNEVTCDTDRKCLMDFAECRPVLRSITVLRKVSDGHYEEESISTSIACECQVRIGSPWHPFIMR